MVPLDGRALGQLHRVGQRLGQLVGRRRRLHQPHTPSHTRTRLVSLGRLTTAGTSLGPPHLQDLF